MLHDTGVAVKVNDKLWIFRQLINIEPWLRRTLNKSAKFLWNPAQV